MTPYEVIDMEEDEVTQPDEKLAEEFAAIDVKAHLLKAIKESMRTAFADPAMIVAEVSGGEPSTSAAHQSMPSVAFSSAAK